jgi:hypothetical protein
MYIHVYVNIYKHIYVNICACIIHIYIIHVYAIYTYILTHVWVGCGLGVGVGSGGCCWWVQAMRKAELEKIENLDQKITIELQTLNERRITMTDELKVP